MALLLATFMTMALLLIPPLQKTALAGDEGLPLAAAADAGLQSEIISLTPAEAGGIALDLGEGTPIEPSKGVTFEGTKFKVFCQGRCDDLGAQILKGEGLTISSLDGGTLIRSVDLRFSQYRLGGDHEGTLSVDVGTLGSVNFSESEDEIVATISDVNAAGVTLSTSYESAEDGGPVVDQVTIYYDKAANPLRASAVKDTQTLTYNTKAQSLAAASVFEVSGAQGDVTFSKVSGDDGITVSTDGEVTVKGGLSAGTYEVEFAVRAADDEACEEATVEVPVTFVINKAANPLKASAVKARQTLTYKNVNRWLKPASVFKVSGAQGGVTFSKVYGNADIVVFTDGEVTVKRSLGAGTYEVTVNVRAAGDANYSAATRTVTVNFKVKKAANPLAVKPVMRKAGAAKVAKQSVTVARPIKVTKKKGQLTYAKVGSGSSKYLSVDAEYGRVTVKKGTPKGTYKIKIKVIAAGNNYYKRGSKTIVCKVKVV